MILEKEYHFFKQCKFNIWLNCQFSAKFISTNNAKIKLAPTIPNLQYAKVGQPKVNNIKVMCHLSMKFSDMFDENNHCTFDKIKDKRNEEQFNFFTNIIEV